MFICKSYFWCTGHIGGGPYLTQGYGLPIPDLEERDYFHTIHTFPELTQRELHIWICITQFQRRDLRKGLRSTLGITGPGGLTAEFKGIHSSTP